MSTKALRPWTELVKLHPDVESCILMEAVFAIDPAAIVASMEGSLGKLLANWRARVDRRLAVSEVTLFSETN